MTIQRQYSLPNCTIILQGLSESAGFGPQIEARPLMSILMSVECHFVGHGQPLRGGRDFFESLVLGVSQYAQEFLSQIQVPLADRLRHQTGPIHVYVERISRNLHRLVVKPKDTQDPNQTLDMQMDLTTVQVFDLVEAIDQFLADPQTLPELSLQLAPVPKRYALSREPIAQRAMPAALGASSLALAALALFMLPIPQVKQPEPSPKSPESGPVQSPTSGQSPTPTTPPSPGASSGTLQAPTSPSPTDNPDQSQNPSGENSGTKSAALEITDVQELKKLNQRLYSDVDQAWTTPPSFKDRLTYRVSVRPDGTIVGYKPVNQAALDYANQTPLLNLVKLPAGDQPPTNEPLAQFKMVFTPGGVLEVSPWYGYPTTPGSTTEITDSTQLKGLTEKLHSAIDQQWQGTPTFKGDLIYRVKVSADGTVTSYEPMNQPAVDYAQEVPLPSLLKSNADSKGTQTAPFRVVFKENGVLQVSPWKGF